MQISGFSSKEFVAFVWPMTCWNPDGINQLCDSVLHCCRLDPCCLYAGRFVGVWWQFSALL